MILPDSDQEIFDKTAEHLFTQGNPATAFGAYGCQYRGSDNTKCAFGFWIPDDEYQPDLEGQNVNSEILQNAFPDILNHFSIIKNLQMTHDNRKNWVSTSKMQHTFDGITNRHGLSMDHVKTLSFKDR